MSHLSSNVGIGFADGLCGIGWGICYLLENHYLEGEADEILQEIDAKVLEYEPLRMIDLSVETGLAGIAVYLAKRKSFIDSFSSNPYFNDYLLALEVRLKNYKNRHILDFMKKLNAIRLSEAKELTPNEQKQLWGGTDGLILACHCTCHDVSAGLSNTDAVWMTYTSSGSCSATSVYNSIVEYCHSKSGTCVAANV